MIDPLAASVGGPGGLDLLGRLLPTFALLLAAAVAARWWARRVRGDDSHGLRVVARTGLAKGAVVAVVEVGQRRYLLGATDHQVRLLGELPETAGDPTDRVAQAAGTDLAAGTPQANLDRPWMAVLDRLRERTVRSSVREPIRASS